MRFIDTGTVKFLTDFDYIRLGGKSLPPTNPELWKQCKTEREYFDILAERQKIPGTELKPGNISGVFIDLK